MNVNATDLLYKQIGGVGTTSSGGTIAPYLSPLSAPATQPSAPAPAPAPTRDTTYDQWGGQTAYNNLISGFNTQKGNIFSTAGEAADNAGIGLKGSILDFVDSLRSGQSKIDNQAVQNELAKEQGTRGVLGMVGRGIRSGGVTLANKNASDSSASQGIANAYGDLGRRELSGVGNQYALGENAVQQSQADLETQRAAGTRKIGDSKTMIVNQIVGDARNQLASLDAQIANASLPDRINIEASKEQVRQDALGRLQQYDQLLSEQVGGIKATDGDARRSKALELANAGTAPESAFNYTTEVPAQFQGTGPFASELPIFTFGAKKQLA